MRFVIAYLEIFQRNIGIFSEKEQLILKNSTALIAGTGGIGRSLAEILVRMGFGKLILAEVVICESYLINLFIQLVIY